MAELVDAQDLKSCVGQPTCQFDSGSRHKGLPEGRPFFMALREPQGPHYKGVALWSFIHIPQTAHSNLSQTLQTKKLLSWGLDSTVAARLLHAFS